MENFPNTPRQPEQGQRPETLQEAWERIQREVALQQSTPTVRASLEASRRITQGTKNTAHTVGEGVEGAEATLSRFEERVGAQAIAAQEVLAAQFEALHAQMGGEQSL